MSTEPCRRRTTVPSMAWRAPSQPFNSFGLTFHRSPSSAWINSGAAGWTVNTLKATDVIAAPARTAQRPRAQTFQGRDDTLKRALQAGEQLIVSGESLRRTRVLRVGPKRPRSYIGAIRSSVASLHAPEIASWAVEAGVDSYDDPAIFVWGTVFSDAVEAEAFLAATLTCTKQTPAD